jgi:drug/metabolite transporter (DMT)-like permease
MSRDRAGVLLILISAVSFGFMPIFAKLAYEVGVGVDELLFVRFLIAFLIMGGILVGTRRFTIPTGRDLIALIALGSLGYFLQSTLYFTSIVYSPVPIAALLLYTYPVFVTAGAFALGWEKITRNLIAIFAVALVGLLLVANPFGNPVGFGVILALGASITYTLYILGGTRVLGRVKGDVGAFYVIGAASVSFALDGVLTGSIHLNWGFEAWFWVAMTSVVCTVIAITAFFLGLAKIGPSKASLISLVEPVTSVLASTWLFGNVLTLSQWFGGLLILIATATTAMYSRPRPREGTD